MFAAPVGQTDVSGICTPSSRTESVPRSETHRMRSWTSGRRRYTKSRVFEWRGAISLPATEISSRGGSPVKW